MSPGGSSNAQRDTQPRLVGNPRTHLCDARSLDVLPGGRKSALCSRPSMARGRLSRQWTLRLLATAVAVAATACLPHAALGECVAALRPDEPAFDVCRTGETVCWLYLSEKPFIVVDPPANASVDAARRRPHRCADHDAYGVSGSSFAILAVVSLTDPMTSGAKPDHMCVFAGTPDECSFNQAVAFIDASGTNTSHRAYGLVLGIHGALLFTPERASVGRWLESIFRVRGRAPLREC